MNDELSQQEGPGILWSAVSRNDIILAEAGEDRHDGAVVELAQKLLKKKPTAGWEFTRSRKSGIRGIKFHVIDEHSDDVKLIWSFSAIAPSALQDKQIKSFLEKLVYVTEPLREDREEFRKGGTLACQEIFAPTLVHLMEEVSHRGKLAMVNQKVDSCKDIMNENINVMLASGEKLDNIEERAESLSFLSKQFKKRATSVRRFQAWQNAKYGIVVGTLVTGAVAAIT